MTLLDAVIDSLAVHRATRLVIEDEITTPLRDAILHSHPPATSKIGYILTCPYCSSIYLAAAVTATHIPKLKPLRPIVYLLAIADLTAILAENKKSSTGWS